LVPVMGAPSRSRGESRNPSLDEKAAVGRSASKAVGASGWRRHLDGWPLGAWLVAVSALTALLAVPRNVPPVELPLPSIDRQLEREAAEIEATRAERARAGLPLEVRAIGEAVRRQGVAAFSQRELVPQLVRPLRRRAAEALERLGPEPLLELRALQTELFLQAFSERPAEPPREAIELAGGLLDAGLARGWFAPPPEGAEDTELAALFRIHWARLLGFAERYPFAPSLNEWRSYYRFLLRRPIPSLPHRDGDLARKLEYVALLTQHDQDYPALLARGILSYQRGAPAEATMELSAHLERHPDGPWALRAQNHLAACGALLSE
jgi:hypothetical protein